MKIVLQNFAMILLMAVAAPLAASEFRGITLGLVSTSWNTQLPPAVAERAGFFRDEGLEVRSVTVASGGPIMMALLTSGQAEMVIVGAVAMLRGIASGAPAMVVGGVVDKPDYTLVGAKGMKSLAAPLSSGERVRVEKQGFPILLEIGKALPDFPFTVVAATKRFAASNPDKVAAVLRALSRAMRLIRENKDSAVELGRMHRLRGEPEVQRRALDYVAEDFDVRLKKENVAALLNVLGLKGGPDEFFDESYLRRSEVTR